VICAAISRAPPDEPPAWARLAACLLGAGPCLLEVHNRGGQGASWPIGARPRLDPREEMQDRGIGFHPAGIRCRLVDATECPVLTSTAACVPSPLRLARIGGFPGAQRTAGHGRPALPGLSQVRTRIRALPAWPAITAGHVTLDPDAERIAPLAPATSSLFHGAPKPLAARTGLASCPFRKTLGRVHSATPAHLLVWQAAPRQVEPPFLGVIERKDSAMLGYAAAVIFLIAFLINATSAATSAVFRR
jgi:hypothetical protein